MATVFVNKELVLNSNLLEAIIQSSEDAIICNTLNGIVTGWNPGAEKLFGYTAAEMISQSTRMLFPPERKTEENDSLDQLKRGLKIDQFETVRLRKDGSKVDISVTISPIFDKQSNLIGALEIARDINPRKKLELQLAEYANQIEDLYNHTPCGQHALNRDGVYIQINDTELNWLGDTRDEILGKRKMIDFIIEQDKNLFTQSFQQCIEHGHVENVELELIGKNGNHRHVSVNTTAMTDNTGNFIKSRSVMHDITALKASQQHLEQLTALQDAMLNNEIVGMVRLINRRMVKVNKAMEIIFGYAPGELNNQASRILYGDDASYENLGLNAYPTLDAGGFFRTQMQMRRKNGQPIWVDMSGVKLASAENESLWMMLDITELKQHERKIERLAFHDILTGLPNRLLISDRLRQAMALVKRNRQSLAVCYLDLDGFKPVNDTYGHDAGDKLLMEIAKRLEASLRSSDTVGRLGGDEFVLLLVGLETASDYRIALQRILDEINAPVSLDGQTQVHLGASIGVTVFPKDQHHADILLRHADHAMYQAKKAGRNRICFYQKSGSSKRK